MPFSTLVISLLDLLGAGLFFEEGFTYPEGLTIVE